jgi:hypothetical protein
MQQTADKFNIESRDIYMQPRSSVGAPTACYPNSDPETELQIAIQLDGDYSGGELCGRDCCSISGVQVCPPRSAATKTLAQFQFNLSCTGERTVTFNTITTHLSTTPIKSEPRLSTVQSLLPSLRCAGTQSMLGFDEMYHIEE